MESKTPGKIIQIDEHLVQSQLKDVVKANVEETLNKLLSPKFSTKSFEFDLHTLYFRFTIFSLFTN
jgi:hypothetical protein